VEGRCRPSDLGEISSRIEQGPRTCVDHGLGVPLQCEQRERRDGRGEREADEVTAEGLGGGRVDESGEGEGELSGLRDEAWGE